MEIRSAKEADLLPMMKLYESARQFMAEHGNPNQWGPTRWPPAELIHSDIASGCSYVCTDEGRIAGAFTFLQGADVEPAYRTIVNGAWQHGGPYGVVHRLTGSRGARGVGAFCLDWAFAQCGHLRVDTHADNRIMQRLLEENGFVLCGTICVAEDCSPRLAYEKYVRTQRSDPHSARHALPAPFSSFATFTL